MIVDSGLGAPGDRLGSAAGNRTRVSDALARKRIALQPLPCHLSTNRTTMTEEQVATFDLGVVLRFADLATANLGEAREEIDALNVYPVPDGDTGTNMFLTMSAARDALREATGGDPGADLRLGLHGFSRGALLGARGNSGVILSQLIGAFITRLAKAGPHDRSAKVFAQALQAATDASYAAVGIPGRGHDPLGRPGRQRGGPRRRRTPRPAARPRRREGGRRGARGARADPRPAATAQAGRGGRRRWPGPVRGPRRRRDRPHRPRPGRPEAGAATHPDADAGR